MHAVAVLHVASCVGRGQGRAASQFAPFSSQTKFMNQQVNEKRMILVGDEIYIVGRERCRPLVVSVNSQTKVTHRYVH